MDTQAPTSSLQPSTTKEILSLTRRNIKSQITQILDVIKDKFTPTEQEIQVRVNLLKELWDKFCETQAKIEQLVDEANYKEEEKSRGEFSEKYVKGLSVLEGMRTKQKDNTWNFTPLQEDETLANFLKRLEVYTLLKGDIEEKTKACLLLNGLTPRLCQKIHDLCSPDDPLTKDYDSLVKVLRENDSKTNILQAQYKFTTRSQYVQETASEFATGLKKLAANCQFNCRCGSSSDLFLRLQFIKGLKSEEIRGRLLQESDEMSFENAVKLATSLERPNVVSNKAGEASILTNRLTNCCFRCGGKNHYANTCKYINENCRFCQKKGHIARACLRNPGRMNMVEKKVEIKRCPIKVFNLSDWEDEDLTNAFSDREDEDFGHEYSTNEVSDREDED